jgi:hypothetical protein
MKYFNYWYKHWKVFQLTAIKLKCWKFKYLLHDIEKPFMCLFMDKESVSKWHRTHRKHHVEYPNYKKWDFEQMIIDWECARITKADKPMTAFETYNWYISNYKFKDFDSKFIFIIAINFLLKELKLWN